MRLDGWTARLNRHKSKIRKLETSGEMTEIWKYNKPRFRKLYQRLGVLQQKVNSLRAS